MKKMVLDMNAGVCIENEDRLEQVLADGEQILNRVNMRLDSIDERQKQIEKTMNAIDGLSFFIDWKLQKEGAV